MTGYLRTALDSPNRWFLLAVMGTTLFFATLLPVILSPVFLVITTWKYGRNMGLAVTALSTFLLMVLFHFPMAIIFIVQFAVIGVLLGEGLREKRSALSLLFTTSLISTLLIIAAGAFYFSTFDAKPADKVQEWSQTLQFAFEENAERYKLDSEELMRYKNAVQGLIDFTRVAFPALLFINTFSIVYLNLLVPLFLAGRLGFDRSHIPPLREIPIPFAWVWGLIISGSLYLLHIPYLKWVGLNVALIFLLAYLMQGYAILSFYLNRTRLPGIFKGLVYLVFLLSVPLIITLCGVGLFDTWFNFRKRSAQGTT